MGLECAEAGLGLAVAGVGDDEAEDVDVEGVELVEDGVVAVNGRF